MTKEEKRKIRESQPKRENYESDMTKVVHYDVDNDDLDYYHITYEINKVTGETYVYKDYYECPF